MTKAKDVQISALEELNAMHQENEHRLDAENFELKKALKDELALSLELRADNRALQSKVDMQAGWINCKMDRMPDGYSMTEPDRVEGGSFDNYSQMIRGKDCI